MAWKIKKTEPEEKNIVVMPAGDGVYNIESFRDGSPLHFRMRVVGEGEGAKLHCSCPAGLKGSWCIHWRSVNSYINARDRTEAARMNEKVDQGQTSLGLGTEREGTAGPQAPAEKSLALGYDFGVVTSAMQKEVRAGNVERAVYWGLLLYDRSPHYAWKRVLVIAAEDVGFANVEAVQLTCSLATAWKQMKETSMFVSPHLLTMALAALCRGARSTWVEDLQSWTQQRQKKGDKLEILSDYIDGHTKQGKEAKVPWGPWYVFRHQVCRIPVNEYSLRLWKLDPSWKPTFTEAVPYEKEPGFGPESRTPEEIEKMLEGRTALGVKMAEKPEPFKVR